MSNSPQKLSRGALIGLVVGSMIGAGIFSLPARFGQATGVLGALIAWTIAGVGMLMLAFVFQRLAQRKPEIDAGIFAYAKDGFGPYLGFIAAFGFWAGTCVGNVSYWITISNTLAVFGGVPTEETGFVLKFLSGFTGPTGEVSLQALIVSSVAVWLFHMLILRGVKEASGLNKIVTIAKILPIFIFILVLIRFFQLDLFTGNFWGAGDNSFSSIMSQVNRTMLITVFVFVGIEGASVYSRYAKNRQDVGVATVLGFIGVLCIMMLVTLLSYGVVAQEQLANMPNPSMMSLLTELVGTWGGILIGIGLIVSVLGAYLSWSLLAAEVLWSAAKYHIVPKRLAIESDKKVPAAALWLTNLTIQGFLILTYFSNDAFVVTQNLTSSLSLIPYFLVAAYAAKLVLINDSSYATEPLGKRSDLIIASIATLYSFAMLLTAGIEKLLLTVLIFLPGSIMYILAKREQKQKWFTRSESIVFGVIVLASVVTVYGIAAGKSTIFNVSAPISSDIEDIDNCFGKVTVLFEDGHYECQATDVPLIENDINTSISVEKP
ncbi:arginine:ornithine antiporter, APA family (TC 2.A.3.2.3) [Thorsellia anophelis DSM 18579]|uniref:Arginine:ornithine antiporter, APA family (TC 2.A.3.2.3) n=2 Tax=Thorsellia anophelis TaxID=336804 RepID=A0A1I0E647_9GAMM|nr:arginine:ornithine antiporter, APA family (TC 2.A.3.2.3) [Thorsellia anophelis DSM 18579]